MYTPDPDFEAMKDITRLFWRLDMNPVPPAGKPAVARDAPSRESA